MKLLRPLILFALFLALTLVGPVTAQDAEEDLSRYAGSPDFPTPDFPTGLDWVNVPGPLTFDDLEGKVVLLDFWTYGCINCLHMIPTLERLEEKYHDELVIIGVHSAKFDNEGQTSNIEQIVQRYNVRHPVINDSDFATWQTFAPYGVRAWPTFVIVDPRGNLFAVEPGEIPFEVFDAVIGNMVTYFDTQGELNREPLEITPVVENQPARALNFPGKVLADTVGNRLFIADSVNHRLVIADLQTFEVLDVIGTGRQGYTDGSFDEAQFYKPQGMALRDEVLYVADTFNHVVRAVDLTEGTVETIAGTGVQGRGIPQGAGFPALATDLRSPWDVEFGEGNTLFVAMAGTHQIWSMDITTFTMSWAVGNGREALFNATPLNSELAQPSGLFYEEGRLAFADSESSSIRVADFDENEVFTVSGPLANDLFTFGDEDGPVGQSRLQHALGVVGAPEGGYYIADTYNSRIKRVELIDDRWTTTTLFGLGGLGGFADGGPEAAAFDEPGGLDYADGLLYVADTNNHAIRIIDLETETVSTVEFPNPEALAVRGGPTVIGGNAGANTLLTLDEATVGAGEGELVLNLLLPEGYKINDLAPSTVALEAVGDAIELTETDAVLTEPTLSVSVALAEGEATVFASVDLYYCEAVNESLCFIETFGAELPVVVAEEGESATLTIEREVIPPDVSAVSTLSS